MKKVFLVLFSLVAFSPLFAQVPAAPQQQQPQEVVIHLQQSTPTNAPAIPAQTVVQKANEWVEFGKNVGTAMDAGLNALTEHADKFSKTDAGRFTMAIIAWKVAGRDAIELTERAIHIAVGIPLLVAWNILSFWFFRRMFLPRRVVIESSGWFWWAKRKYEVVNQDDNWSEGKSFSAWATCAAWVGFSILIIAQVIL